MKRDPELEKELVLLALRMGKNTKKRSITTIARDTAIDPSDVSKYLTQLVAERRISFSFEAITNLQFIELNEEDKDSETLLPKSDLVIPMPPVKLPKETIAVDSHDSDDEEELEKIKSPGTEIPF
jgi:hypothetical protein